MRNKKIAVIGGGLTGLTAAYCLTKRNFDVTIFEKEDHLGGLAATFKDKNWKWPLEIFFHHLFTSDHQAKNLINELGLGNKLFFKKSPSSIFYGNRIYRFDSAMSVLKFSPLTFFNRLRTGLATVSIKTFLPWQIIENKPANIFSKQFFGQQVSQILWQPLLKGKFGSHQQTISAAWFWARIKKRSSKLGYLEGSFQVLIDKLEKEIKRNKGQIKLNQEIKSLNQLKNFDNIIITTAGQLFDKKQSWPKMIGAINLVLSLKKPFFNDGTYWLNINDNDFPFIAVVEQTNFVDQKNYNQNSLLYLGGYYPSGHPFFKYNQQQLLKKFLPFLKRINPEFKLNNNLNEVFIFKKPYAQPIMPTGYSRILNQLQKQNGKSVIANMQLIYPYDRGINYAIKIGQEAAGKIN